MAYVISEEECIQCGCCVAVCPANCIVEEDGKYVIEPFGCLDCGACAGVCPCNATAAFI